MTRLTQQGRHARCGAPKPFWASYANVARKTLVTCRACHEALHRERPRRRHVPRGGQQHRGPALVTILLLHAGRRTASLCARIRWPPNVRIRAILKAADVCATEPERAAQFMVDRGFTPRYDYALQAIEEIPYKQVAGV